MSYNDGVTPGTGIWLYPANGPAEGREATPAEADRLLGDTPRDDASIIQAWRDSHDPSGT